MKSTVTLLFTLLLALSASASGSRKEVELSTRISKENSSIFLIKLIDFSPVEIEEFRSVAGGEGIRKFATVVEIAEIIHAPESNPASEEWSVAFESESTKPLAKYRVHGKAETGDTVIVMNGEDIERSYIYYVENRKRSFYYYYSPLAAEPPLFTDQHYIFISNGAPSEKNGVYLGNIGYGFYPDSEEIRHIITSRIH